MDTPEKKSDYAKRVLFGGPKPAAVATAAAAADKQAGGGGGSGSRSGSQSSTCSAPGSAIYSAPGTPRSATNGELPLLQAASDLGLSVCVCVKVARME